MTTATTDPMCTARLVTTATDPAMTSPLLSLMWLASPALPVGGFSYSEGLEAAIEAGLVHDETTAARWLVDQLHLTLARADLVVLGEATRAWRQHDWATLQSLDAWVRQTRESSEFKLQTEQMGRSLMEWLKSLQTHQTALAALPDSLRAPTYPVAFACALAWNTAPDTPLRDGLLAYAFGWAENMVQAAIKTVPLGQSAGQRILAQLCLSIPTAVETALQTSPAQRQSFSPMLAILSAQHETQYSRLFRS